MLSAIVVVGGTARPVRTALRPDQLARTLSALVPAAVEGLLADVALAGTAIDGMHRVVAEHAGASLVEAGSEAEALAAAARAATRPLVFVLMAGAVPEAGVTDEIGWLAREDPGLRRSLVLRERRARSWSLRRPAILGLVVASAGLRAAMPADFAALTRRKPARDLVATASLAP